MRKFTSVVVSISIIFFVYLTSCSLSYRQMNNDAYQEAIYDQGDEYLDIVENDFITTLDKPLSTFSVDSSTSAYPNIRRIINQGAKVPANAVKIEEVVNYFKYDYESPSIDDVDPLKVNAEIGPSPWNENGKLISVGLKAKEIELGDLPRNNLVFLLDVSGSMDLPNKIGLMQDAFSLLCDNISDDDIISIVTYASSDAVLLNGESGVNRKRIKNIIEDLAASGSTHGSKGIQTAYQIAKANFIEGGNNRIILATDGDFNVGISSTFELKSFIKTKKDQDNIFLSVMGFGFGNYKSDTMDTLAQNGNGNAYYIDSINEARKVLVEEMGGTLVTVAKDCKVQVEFNPHYIKKYRLLGYENKMLNDDDFEDDNVDAGEIGAGHTVTAIYEVIFEDGEVTSTLENNYLKVGIRYKHPTSDESNLIETFINIDHESATPSNDFIFQTALVEACLILSDSKYKGTSSYQAVVNRLNDISESLDAYKLEFLELVKKLSD